MNSSRQCCVPMTVAAAIAVLAITPGACFSEEPGVRFLPAHAPSIAASEPVVVLEPAGGQYVYSEQLAAARARARFAIGKAPRTEYALFSAEEQRELQALRDRMSAAQPHASTPDVPLAQPEKLGRSVARHPHAKRVAKACAPAGSAGDLEALSWPKVVQDGTRVCVPKLEFADKADWRDHVWCFDSGDGHVR